jgi:hypothetical protein
VEFTSNEILDIFAKSDDLADLIRRGRVAAAALVRENEALRERLESIEQPDQSPGSPAAMEALARGREENERLRAELEALDSENRRFAHRCIEIESQNEALVNLYVANCQLHSSLEPSDVTLAIQDIVVGLIGAEEWALFEREPESGDFVVTAGAGVETRFPTGRLRVGEGPEGRVLDTGVPSFDEAGSSGGQVALLPLLTDGVCVGLIAVYRMLGHKQQQYSPIDYELLNLLSGQAATALTSSRLFAARLRSPQPM